MEGEIMYLWECRQCGEQLEAPESLGNESIECPECGVFSRPPQAPAPRLKQTASPVLPVIQKSNRNHPDWVYEIKGPRGVFAWGWLITVVGIITTLYAFNMDTTYRDTHNLGLLNDRLVTTITGSIIGASGVILIGLGVVGAAIVKAVATKQKSRVRADG